MRTGRISPAHDRKFGCARASTSIDARQAINRLIQTEAIPTVARRTQTRVPWAAPCTRMTQPRTAFASSDAPQGHRPQPRGVARRDAPPPFPLRVGKFHLADVLTDEFRDIRAHGHPGSIRLGLQYRPVRERTPEYDCIRLRIPLTSLLALLLISPCQPAVFLNYNS